MEIRKRIKFKKNQQKLKITQKKENMCKKTKKSLWTYFLKLFYYIIIVLIPLLIEDNPNKSMYYIVFIFCIHFITKKKVSDVLGNTIKITLILFSIFIVIFYTSVKNKSMMIINVSFFLKEIMARYNLLNIL